MSKSDEGAYREPQNALVLTAEDLALRTAIYPVLRRIRMHIAARNAIVKPFAVPTEWKPDIPLELYKHNLRRIAELARARGADVWFLTSSHAFLTDENRGQYDKFPNTSTGKALLALNALPSFERLIEIHDMYNAASRDVGRELGVPVIDMEAEYRKHSKEHLYGNTDVIHPNQEGHNLEAEVLYERIRTTGMLHPD